MNWFPAGWECLQAVSKQPERRRRDSGWDSSNTVSNRAGRRTARAAAGHLLRLLKCWPTVGYIRPPTPSDQVGPLKLSRNPRRRSSSSQIRSPASRRLVMFLDPFLRREGRVAQQPYLPASSSTWSLLAWPRAIGGRGAGVRRHRSPPQHQIWPPATWMPRLLVVVVGFAARAALTMASSSTVPRFHSR